MKVFRAGDHAPGDSSTGGEATYIFCIRRYICSSCEALSSREVRGWNVSTPLVVDSCSDDAPRDHCKATLDRGNCCGTLNAMTDLMLEYIMHLVGTMSPNLLEVWLLVHHHNLLFHRLESVSTIWGAP